MMCQLTDACQQDPISSQKMRKLTIQDIKVPLNNDSPVDRMSEHHMKNTLMGCFTIFLYRSVACYTKRVNVKGISAA